MNAQMRRYLDENWEADDEPEPQEADTTKTTKPRAQDRRQTEKQRGKAISKFLRDRAKTDTRGKP